MLSGGKSLAAIARLSCGVSLGVFGRPQSLGDGLLAAFGRVSTDDRAAQHARQLIGMTPSGELVVCLCGHAGQGPVHPPVGPSARGQLTVQPNDLVLRFDGLVEDLNPAASDTDPARLRDFALRLADLADAVTLLTTLKGSLWR